MNDYEIKTKRLCCILAVCWTTIFAAAICTVIIARPAANFVPLAVYVFAFVIMRIWYWPKDRDEPST